MQPNIEQLMTKQDFITLLEKMNSIEAMLKEKQAEEQPDILLYNLDDIAKFLKCSKKMAQRLKNMPNFPQSELPRRGKYKKGPFSSFKVLKHYNINKNKV